MRPYAPDHLAVQRRFPILWFSRVFSCRAVTVQDYRCRYRYRYRAVTVTDRRAVPSTVAVGGKLPSAPPRRCRQQTRSCCGGGLMPDVVQYDAAVLFAAGVVA